MDDTDIPFFAEFFLNEDHGEHITANLDWPAIRALSQASKAGRLKSQREFKQRLKLAVNDYLPDAGFNSFIDMLRNTRGAISGATPNIVMNMGTPFDRFLVTMTRFVSGNRRHKARFHDLQVIVPQENWDIAVNWLRREGYEEYDNMRVAPLYKNVVSRAGWTKHKTKMPEVAGRKGFTLLAAKVPLYQVALTSPWSAETSMITSSACINFFPNQTSTTNCLQRRASTPNMRIPQAHWLTCATQVLDIAPCGRACPALDINQAPKSTPLVYHWNEDGNANTLTTGDDLEFLTSQFRRRCFNRHCIMYSSPTAPL